MRLAFWNLSAALLLGVSPMLASPSVAAAPELSAGDLALVLGTGGSGVRVRSGPGPTYEVLGSVSEGAQVTVLNGPQSDGDLAWYRIRTKDGTGDGVRGWAAAMYLVDASAVKEHEDGTFGTRRFEAKIMGYASGGSIGFYTSTGTRVQWGTVAVDPRFIPLGSLMLVDGLDGVFRAEDTGPGVRGAIVDVWFPDRAAAVAWGTRHRKVTVLREGY